MNFLFYRWKKSEQRIADWASILGGVLAVAAIIPFIWPDSVKQAILASGLVLVILGASATALFASWHLERKARYVEALELIRDAVRKITEEDAAQHHTWHERKCALAAALDDMSRAFSIVAGAVCRCCVKTVGTTQSGSIGVIVLCRNEDTGTKESMHAIEHNSDFDDLYQDPLMKWFFGNNLPELARQGKYRNTTKDWQSRYRAAVVWPIRPAPGAAGGPELRGFLCVDSKKTHAFSEDHDYPIGAIIADALCQFLLKMVNEPAAAQDSRSRPEVNVEDSSAKPADQGLEQ